MMWFAKTVADRAQLWQSLKKKNDRWINQELHVHVFALDDHP
jgi:hypothetical protein